VEVGQRLHVEVVGEKFAGGAAGFLEVAPAVGGEDGVVEGGVAVIHTIESAPGTFTKVVLHQPGIDHSKLTYRSNGIDRRLTDRMGT
jgi:hypothetical protein